ncbi:MAG: Ankyrin repeats (3 copies) [bacterium ADurb.Bin243]|nr:MAG: Ankyrin repeats (3 copies) [bacterium ADurb.Bin243]
MKKKLLKLSATILSPVFALSFFLFFMPPSCLSAEELLFNVSISNIKPDLTPMQLEEILVSIIYNDEPAAFSCILSMYKEKLTNSYIFENLLNYPEIYKNPDFIKSIISFIDDFKSMPDGGKKFLEKTISMADTELIDAVIKKGAAINNASDQFKTPIIFNCLKAESFEILKVLIDNGANVNVLHGEASLLYYAVENKSTQSVYLLLQSGADVNLSKSPAKKSLNAALKNGDLELVKVLIDKKADENIFNKSYYKSLINYLIDNFSDEIVLYCIESGYVKKIDDLKFNGRTPLLSALIKNKRKTADALAKRGSKLAVSASGDRYFDDFKRFVIITESGEVSLMHYLTRKENIALLEPIIKNGLDYEFMKEYKNNFLFSAIDNRCSEAVELILKNYKDRDWRLYGQTPVEYTFLKGEFKMCDTVKSLLKDSPGNINDYNIKEKNGAINPKLIINTVKNRNIEGVKMLIKCGADFNAHDEHESPALHWAVLWGMFDVVKLLVENGAEINEVNYYDKSSLLLTALNENKPEIARYLIEKGADLNFADSESYKILHTAVDKNYADIAGLILKRGYDVNKRDRYYETAIFDAIDKNFTECFTALIENSAEINICNHDGETPLHLAAKKGNIGFAEKLIARGAVVDSCGVSQPQKPKVEKIHENSNLVTVSMLIPKRDGPYMQDNMITPLTAAIIAKKPDMVNFLIKKGADVNMLSAKKLAPIHYAINTFQNDIFDSLISRGIDLKIKTSDGYDLLCYAAFYDNLYAVKKLAGLGFKIDNVSSDLNSETALHISEKRGASEVSEYLRKNGADASKKNYFGKTPDDFKKERHLKAVETLGKAIKTTDNDELIKISNLSGEAFREICHIACGCDHDPGPSRYTPSFMALPDIQKAVWLNMFDAVEAYLYNESADAKRNELGRSIFDPAVKLKRKKIIHYLLSDEFNFDISPDSLFKFKNNGWLDLLDAAISRSAKIDALENGKSIFHYVDYKTFIKLAVAFKNYKFSNDMQSGLASKILSSTERFTTEECLSIMKVLSERGYDFNVRPREEHLPVFSAVKHRVDCNSTSGIEIVKTLIASGADIKLKERYNENIMELAAARLNAEVVNLLMKHGAEIKGTKAISTALKSFIDDFIYNSKLSEARAVERFDALIKTMEALKANGLDVCEKDAPKDHYLPIETVFWWRASKNHGPLSKEKAVEYKNILINMLAGDGK